MVLYMPGVVVGIYYSVLQQADVIYDFIFIYFADVIVFEMINAI